MTDQPKTRGAARKDTRTALVDATEQLIQDEGFAGVTSRTVAAKAGVKPPLLHYYFKSMDDLLVEVFRRGAEADLERLSLAMTSDNPLRAMWKLSNDPMSSRFITEFMAIANHVEPVRAEITRYAEKRRRLQADALSQNLQARNIKPEIPPLVVVSLMENVVRGQMLESALGMSLGHEETEAFVRTCLDVFEASGETTLRIEAKPPAKPPRRSRVRAAVKGVRPRASHRRG